MCMYVCAYGVCMCACMYVVYVYVCLCVSVCMYVCAYGVCICVLYVYVCTMCMPYIKEDEKIAYSFP